MLPLFEEPFGQGLMQGNRNGTGRGVSVFLDVVIYLFRRYLELVAYVFDDPQIGLMEDEEIDVRYTHLVVRERLVDDLRKQFQRMFEDLPAFHARHHSSFIQHFLGGPPRMSRSRAFEPQDVRILAVSVEVC